MVNYLDVGIISVIHIHRFYVFVSHKKFFHYDLKYFTIIVKIIGIVKNLHKSSVNEYFPLIPSSTDDYFGTISPWAIVRGL